MEQPKSNNATTKRFSYTGDILEPTYYPTLSPLSFKSYELSEFRSMGPFDNAIFKIHDGSKEIIASSWVSPKRTRSYPYARVYDTLSFKDKKVTIIPFVKDEGENGDRDFVQWDTISFMSLLGIYVILGYYVTAIPNKRRTCKITCQRHEPRYLMQRFKELFETRLSPQLWNLNEVQNKLLYVAQESLKSYEKISRETAIRMHNSQGIFNRVKQIKENVAIYRDMSRVLAKKAQERESITVQPKENVTLARKGVLVLKDSHDGNYFWTTDEIVEVGSKVFLIEKKDSQYNNLPSINDVKDGFLKLIVYSNIVNMKNDIGENVTPIPCLGLTSRVASGACWNYCKNYDKIGLESGEVYLGKQLKLGQKDKNLLRLIFNEGIKNKILVYFIGNDSLGLEEKIIELSSFSN
jgi:hypothetical protein